MGPYHDDNRHSIDVEIEAGRIYPPVDKEAMDTVPQLKVLMLRYLFVVKFYQSRIYTAYCNLETMCRKKKASRSMVHETMVEIFS